VDGLLAGAPVMQHHSPAEEPGRIRPPASVEAEREVLAAVFVGGSAVLEQVVKACTPELFWVERHRHLFGALVDLHERQVPVDPVTVAQALKDRGDYERVGGARGLGELLDRAGTVGHLEHYLGTLRDKAALRRMLDHARRVETAVLQDVPDVGELVGSLTAEWEVIRGRVAPPTPPIAFSTLGEIQVRDQCSWLEDAPPKATSLLTCGYKPYLRDGRVGLLVAPGGNGKSFALMQLAIAVATGQPWLGTYQVERKGKVLLACGEEDVDEVRRRLHSVTRDLGEYERYELARNLVPLGLAGTRTSFLERKDGVTAVTPWYTQFSGALQAHDWRAIILDPLSRWGGPEVETDANAATELVTLLETLTKAPGNPAVIAAHHERKSNGSLSDASSVRGSSALVDGPRWVANLRRRRKGDLLEIAVTKANNTVAPPPLVLKRGQGGLLRPATGQEIADAEVGE